MAKKRLRFSFIVLLLMTLAFFLTAGGTAVFADAPFTLPNLDVNVGTADTPQEVSSTIQIVLMLTVLSMAPSILLMMTCFTRIIIIFSFLRKALSLQTTPPNQVLIGLALFLTFFVMAPTFTEINENAYKPLSRGEITLEQAYDNAMAPMREFMFRQVRSKDLALFVKLADAEMPENLEAVPDKALIPAFIISELRTGFEVGFLLFVPFIVIDMVVASTLMALGMMMLPPVMISLPFKILLFILIDGWNLIVRATLAGIR